MKRTLLLLLLLPFLLFTQNQRAIDSLELAFKKATHDTTRCLILGQLVTKSNDVSVMRNFNDRLLKHAQKCVGSSKDTSNASKVLCLKYLGIAYTNQGVFISYKGDMIKSLDSYFKALSIYEKINEKNEIAHTFNNIGVSYNNLGNIPKALEFLYKGLKLREENNDKRGVAESYNNLGEIYSQQKDITKALELYSMSLKIQEAIIDKPGIATSLNNIASMHYINKNWQLALEYYFKALKLQEELNKKNSIANTLNNIGTVYREQNNLLKALDFFNKALKIMEEIKNKKGISISLKNIASVKLKQGRLGEAYTFAFKSLQMAKEISIPDFIRSAAQTLKLIYQKQNKHKDALEMYELEILMGDRIKNDENLKTTVKKEMQYEYEKKELIEKAEAEKKEREAKIALEKQMAKEAYEMRVELMLVGVGVFILFFGFIYFSKSIVLPTKTRAFLIGFTALVFFEFIFLFTDPYIGMVTGGKPIMTFVSSIILAFVITPLNERFEKWLNNMIEKRAKLKAQS